jgi:hypothetical protein
MTTTNTTKIENTIDYNVDYETNYNLFFDDSAFEGDETEEDKENIRTLLYQKDLLAVFNENVFDDDIINKKTRELYVILKKNDDLLFCMKELSKKCIYSNEEIGLMMFFSFDYLYLSHPCISEYIKTGSISDANLNILKKTIIKE